MQSEKLQQPTVHLPIGWIPEKMAPGTVFAFERLCPNLNAHHEFFAGTMACLRCESLILITLRQAWGWDSVICGSDTCSAEGYFSGPPDSDDFQFNLRLPM